MNHYLLFLFIPKAMEKMHLIRLAVLFYAGKNDPSFRKNFIVKPITHGPTKFFQIMILEAFMLFKKRVNATLKGKFFF